MLFLQKFFLEHRMLQVSPISPSKSLFPPSSPSPPSPTTLHPPSPPFCPSPSPPLSLLLAGVVLFHFPNLPTFSPPPSASPQIIQASSGEIQVNINEDFRLAVVATAPQSQELYYQWFRDGQPMPYATGNELYIQHVQLGDQGVYSCRVSTKLGGSKLTDETILHGELW